MTEEQARILSIQIGTACNLYEASAKLASVGRIDDADNAAQKARFVMNKALIDAGIENKD